METANLLNIKASFITNRGWLEWNMPRSRRQVEYECGPRMLKGILGICRGIKENILSIEDCIQRALLTDRATAQSYNSGKIRREIRALARTHNQSMRTERITFRQRGIAVTAGRGLKTKRIQKTRNRTSMAPTESFTLTA